MKAILSPVLQSGARRKERRAFAVEGGIPRGVSGEGKVYMSDNTVE